MIVMLDEMRRAATFGGPGDMYRYTLHRWWSHGGAHVCWIMLNPSTADAEKEDPTVRRCIGYSSRWGYSSLTVLNLFALRSTDPRQLYTAGDPIGPGNDAAILAEAAVADLVVCAWGNHGEHLQRGVSVARRLMDAGVLLSVLKLTGRGQPSHPLYLPNDQQLTAWVPR